MTRAKERLTLTHSMRRSLFGRSEANLPSRFLDELPALGVERERLRPASWSDYGARTCSASSRRARTCPTSATGDAVRHASLGSGIVLRDRSRRRRDRALRGRQRAAADARLRAAGEDRCERSTFAPCASLGRAARGAQRDQPLLRLRKRRRGRRALRAVARARPHARGRGTATASSAARVPSRSTSPCPAAGRPGCAG